MTENTIITASGRTKEEITASVRIHMRSMVNNALEIGLDLVEMKDACRHGEWLPWLKEIGLSASTAANYMRIAREVNGDSKMAQLPYTKILALMAAPPEEREELAAAADNMSAAEIRKLTEERNRAAEAANTETMRADQAEDALRKSEAEAKEIYDKNASLRTEMQNLQVKLEKARDGQKQAEAGCDLLKVTVDKQYELIEDLREKLIVAENQQKIEVVPADHEQLKRERQELISAAAEAEERAAAAEAALEDARNENAQGGVDDFEKMHFAMKTFMMHCELMACRPEGLMHEKERARKDVARLRQWCDAMDNALTLHVAEGAVV